MHEYSVVSALLESCLEIMTQNNAKRVLKVIVSVGERANIDKTLLESAFDVLKIEYDCLSEAKIDIITQKLMLKCAICGSEFHSLSEPKCPKCASLDTFIQSGRDILLESLELEIKE